MSQEKPNSSASPGPWRWRQGFTDPPYHKLLDANEAVVLESYDPDALITVSDENATLIASAPDMLALLRQLEWAGPDADGAQDACPVCGRPKTDRGDHWDLGKGACPLGTLLDRVGR